MHLSCFRSFEFRTSLGTSILLWFFAETFWSEEYKFDKELIHNFGSPWSTLLTENRKHMSKTMSSSSFPRVMKIHQAVLEKRLIYVPMNINWVAVARYWMICLVLVNSHSFPLPCKTGSTVPREGFNFLYLALLLVCLMLGCRHTFLRLAA